MGKKSCNEFDLSYEEQMRRMNEFDEYLNGEVEYPENYSEENEEEGIDLGSLLEESLGIEEDIEDESESTEDVHTPSLAYIELLKDKNLEESKTEVEYNDEDNTAEDDQDKSVGRAPKLMCEYDESTGVLTFFDARYRSHSIDLNLLPATDKPDTSSSFEVLKEGLKHALLKCMNHFAPSAIFTSQRLNSVFEKIGSYDDDKFIFINSSHETAPFILCYVLHDTLYKDLFKVLKYAQTCGKSLSFILAVDMLSYPTNGFSYRYATAEMLQNMIVSDANKENIKAVIDEISNDSMTHYFDDNCLNESYLEVVSLTPYEEDPCDDDDDDIDDEMEGLTTSVFPIKEEDDDNETEDKIEVRSDQINVEESDEDSENESEIDIEDVDCVDIPDDNTKEEDDNNYIVKRRV